MAENYYTQLGVSKTASKEEIKKAYKTLAKKYHPDVNKDAGSEEKFKKVSEAYAVLSDDTKKTQYDQYGETDFHQKYSQEDIFRGFNFSDINDAFGNDIFDMFFGGGGRRQTRGRDLRYDVEISFKEAAFGTEKSVRLEKYNTCEFCEGTGAENGKLVTCTTCKGSGQERVTRKTPFGVFSQVGPCRTCKGAGQQAKEACTSCQGSGRILKEKELKIKIPAGVDNGTQLRVNGEGEAGQAGSRSGDLYIFINVEESDIFTREGQNLFLDLPLTFSQAALGEEIEIPTLEKEVTLKIPSGTQTGTKFRLAAKGLPYLNGMGKGDLFIIANVVTPKKLSKEQKKLFEDLKKTEEKKGLLQRIKEFADEL
ncbi:MAG: molecular chaperone DnaJ [Candidatus Nanoarchaeia archaeon]